jgi:hypothetical protein
MVKLVYRYLFDTEVALEEVEAAMVLALFGTESLYGAARTRLEAAQYLDREKRLLVLDASTPVGNTLAKLFTGFLMRELGPDDFHVERVATPPANSFPFERN